MNTSTTTRLERGRPACLLPALQAFAAFSTSHNCPIGISLPPPGQVRARRIVHRGAPRPVIKVPSLALDRIVECESLLEADLATILDACPGVLWFAEQPGVMHYRQAGEAKVHIPDFVVATAERQEFVEVKRTCDITEEVQSRTALLTELLRAYGFGYRLVSDRHIHVGPALGNASSLLARGRHAVAAMSLLQAFETVRKAGSLSLSEFGWSRSGSTAAVAIARLVLEGRVCLDLVNEITTESQVYLSTQKAKENLLWR